MPRTAVLMIVQSNWEHPRLSWPYLIEVEQKWNKIGRTLTLTLTLYDYTC